MHSLITSVTGLRFIPLKDATQPEPFNAVFAGIGNQVHIFQPGKEYALAIWAVFPDGERVHGFSHADENRVVVYGGRYVTILQATVSENAVSGGAIFEPVEFDDWVFDAQWITGGQFVLVAGGHSNVSVCAAHDLTRLFVVCNTEKELTWSTTLFSSRDGKRLRAAAGSSFGDVLIWTVLDATNADSIHEYIEFIATGNSCPGSNKPARAVHRLAGHDGAVMKLRVSQDARRMISASVDRSVRLWEACDSAAFCQACHPDGCFIQKFAHYGHLARVWDVSFLQEDRAGVVSVAEDRTCRVWSEDGASQQLAVYHGHAGRNVWSVDVQFTGEQRSQIASGGEDGCVKIRSIPIPKVNMAVGSGVEAQDVDAESCGSRQCASNSFAIPHKYANPRKSGGAYNESGRTLLLIEDDRLLMSTDFGRILLVRFDDSNSELETKNAESVSWTELYRDSKGIAYTPCSLAYCGGYIFAGQTNGSVTILKLESGSNTGASAKKVGDLAAFLTRNEMVMSLFAAPSLDGKKCNLFAGTGSGELFHWVIHENVDGETRLEFVKTYRQTKVTKSAVVTSVVYIARGSVVVVGDRGGRVLVYDAMQSARVDSNGGNGKTVELFQAAACICRPHQDRVSTIVDCTRRLFSKETAEEYVDGKYEVMTGGFDGCMVRVGIEVKRSDMEMTGIRCEMSVKVISSQKCLERMDTIGRVMLVQNGRGEGIYKRHCVVGFRGCDVIIWDVQERNELFRRNCGNWRRAYDIDLRVGCSGRKGSGRGSGGGVKVESMRLVYWRSGRLHVVGSIGRDEEEGGCVECIGAGFHGMRVNSVSCVGKGVIATAGEDTSVHITRLEKGNWETLQVLRRHVSGVSSVSAVVLLKTGKKMLFSGGGKGEVVGWIAESDEGNWKDVCGVAMRRNGVLQRVMWVVGIDGCLCECDEECGRVLVGGSDGRIGLVRMVSGKADGYRRLGEEWEGNIVEEVLGHYGAVVCGDGVFIGNGMIVVTGDSRGDVMVWWIEKGNCWERKIVKVGEMKGVHDGGVNCVNIEYCGIEEDLVCLVMLSGGDDEKVVVRRLTATMTATMTAAVVGEWISDMGLHYAGVTGVSVGWNDDSNEIRWVSSGADQWVNWGKIDVHPLNVVVQGRRRCNIADVGDLCVMDKCIVLVGCGMELFSFGAGRRGQSPEPQKPHLESLL